MASPTVNSGKDQDLSFDDVKLDDLTLDDDALFADLDNEVRLEGAAGDDGLSLDLNDEDFKLDFDVEAVGAPAKGAGAKSTPGKSAPATPAPTQAASAKSAPPKAGAGKGAAPADELNLEKAELGSLDDLDLDIPDASAGIGDAGLGDFNLDLDASSGEGKGSGGDLDLDLTGAGGEGQGEGDVLDLNIGAEEDAAGGAGAELSGGDDLDLTLDMGPSESAAGQAAAGTPGAGGMDTIELDLGTEQINLEEETAGTIGGGTAAEEAGAEIDLGFDAMAPQQPSPKGAEQLEEIALSEERSGGGAEAVLDTEELPAADLGVEATPQEFQAAPDVDLDAVDLTLDMPVAKSRGDGQAPMAPPEPAAATIATPRSGRLFSGMGTGGREDVVELNLSDLESQPMESAEQTMPGEMAQRKMPAGTTAERVPAAMPKGEAGMAAAVSALAGSVLLSIPHQVQVRMGSVSMQGQDILSLDYGSVVPLNRSVGEPVDLTLNGKTIAQGEIVVINGRNLGVRIVALGG